MDRPAALLEVAADRIGEVYALLEAWEEFLKHCPPEDLKMHKVPIEACRMVNVALDRRPLPGNRPPELVFRFTAPDEVLLRFIDYLRQSDLQLEERPALPGIVRRYRAWRVLN